MATMDKPRMPGQTGEISGRSASSTDISKDYVAVLKEFGLAHGLANVVLSFMSSIPLAQSNYFLIQA